MKITSLHTREERMCALDLAWAVFKVFEANEYGVEGTQNFRFFLDSEEAIQHLIIYGAYEQSTLIGMLAIRLPHHISLFFVSEQHQKKGIGKALFQEYQKRMPTNLITVNSSPYAVTIYEKLGFVKDGEKQSKDGIQYTPMYYKKVM